MMRDFKRLAPLPDQRTVSGMGLGEAFEIAAFDADAEAREFPSRLGLADGNRISLPKLLSDRGDELLGAAFVSQFGACMPLLPKTLDVKELLSVQGHPEGNTEVYIIIAAEPGATLRLGFCQDMDARSFAAELLEGRRRQERVLSLLGKTISPAGLQELLAPWLAERAAGTEKSSVISGYVPDHSQEVTDLLAMLKALYWRVLDAMNEIPVSAGQVIYNANPSRIVAASGREPSAEVHALGNPEGKEFVALEVRRPGPTFRAWDNVRFPIRDVDVVAAIAALNLKATSVEDYLVTTSPVEGQPGVFSSVSSSDFTIQHLRPRPDQVVHVPAEQPHCLHAICGDAQFFSRDGSLITDLTQGESALVPINVGDYRVKSSDPTAEIVKVSLPLCT